MLDKLDFAHPGKDAESWEKAVRKIRAGMMPPGGAPRPDRATLDAFAAKLETAAGSRRGGQSQSRASRGCIA